MHWRRELAKLGALFRRRKPVDDLAEEIRSHLAMEEQENLESGMAPEEARYAALRRFGNVTLAQETSREMWGWNSVETLWQDVRYGLRQLRKNPGFSAVVVLTLALGTGANASIFSLINTLMLRMLPVRDPGQLVELLHRYPGDPRGNSSSWQSYEHYRDHNHVFSGLIGFAPSHFSLRGAGLEREGVDGEYVVGDYFPVLGVKPAIGRLIGPGDDQMGAANSAVAVVSWAFWKSRFNLKPTILGSRIIVDEVPLTVIGVTPREFFGLQIWSRPEVWVPLAMEPAIHHTAQVSLGSWSLKVVGRLQPGVSLEEAQAEMNVLFQFTIEEITKKRNDPLWRQAKMELAPAGAGLSSLRDLYARPLLILMALVGLLLLIACTSIATMLLARAAARQREMALRVCLGAGRLRLLRQVLTEALLLSTAGTLLGVFLAFFGAEALVRIITSGRTMPGLPPQIDIQAHPDGRVLLFAAGIALLTGVLFGLVPAWRAVTVAPAPSLQAAGRAGETRLGRLFGKGLVAAQVALSVVLLSAAILFIGYLENLEHLDLGFRKDHLLLVALESAHSGYSNEALAQRYEELLRRLKVLPGVRSATLCGATPLSGAGASSFANVEGFEEKPEDRRYVSINWVAPNYFHTLGMPLLAGRDFHSEDQGGARVAIINRAMARYYFPGRDPIGKHFTLDRDWKGFGPNDSYEIVGVVGDAHYSELKEEPPRTIYFDTFQGPWVGSQFVLRTSMAPTAAAPEVRQAVREIANGVSVGHITTMADQVDASIVPERVVAMLSGSFGVLGSLLAALGLYGLLAFTVARRTNEIGIRMALGASRASVARMVLRDALGMVLAGLVIGTPLAIWGKQFAASLIQNLPVTSTIPLAFGSLGMISVGLLASYLPTRRATKVDPMTALRCE